MGFILRGLDLPFTRFLVGLEPPHSSNSPEYWWSLSPLSPPINYLTASYNISLHHRLVYDRFMWMAWIRPKIGWYKKQWLIC